jgi:hypothetical protein
MICRRKGATARTCNRGAKATVACARLFHPTYAGRTWGTLRCSACIGVDPLVAIESRLLRLNISAAENFLATLFQGFAATVLHHPLEQTPNLVYPSHQIV